MSFSVYLLISESWISVGAEGQLDIILDHFKVKSNILEDRPNSIIFLNVTL